MCNNLPKNTHMSSADFKPDFSLSIVVRIQFFLLPIIIIICLLSHKTAEMLKRNSPSDSNQNVNRIVISLPLKNSHECETRHVQKSNGKQRTRMRNAILKKQSLSTASVLIALVSVKSGRRRFLSQHDCQLAASWRQHKLFFIMLCKRSIKHTDISECGHER